MQALHHTCCMPLTTSTNLLFATVPSNMGRSSAAHTPRSQGGRTMHDLASRLMRIAGLVMAGSVSISVDQDKV